jgi:solute carrier family 25 citrate transporter 1
MCLFWAKHNMDSLLWNKHEGDGRILTPMQSMASGFLAGEVGSMD